MFGKDYRLENYRDLFSIKLCFLQIMVLGSGLSAILVCRLYLVVTMKFQGTMQNAKHSGKILLLFFS